MKRVKFLVTVLSSVLGSISVIVLTLQDLWSGFPGLVAASLLICIGAALAAILVALSSTKTPQKDFGFWLLMWVATVAFVILLVNVPEYSVEAKIHWDWRVLSVFLGGVVALVCRYLYTTRGS